MALLKFEHVVQQLLANARARNAPITLADAQIAAWKIVELAARAEAKQTKTTEGAPR